jgi:hypothetical protein
MQFDYHPQPGQAPLDLNINLDQNLSLEHLTIIEAGLVSSLEAVRERIKQLEKTNAKSLV